MLLEQYNTGAYIVHHQTVNHNKSQLWCTPFSSSLPLRQQPRRSNQKSINIPQHIKNVRLVVTIQFEIKVNHEDKHNRVPARTTTSLPYLLRIRKKTKYHTNPGVRAGALCGKYKSSGNSPGWKLADRGSWSSSFSPITENELVLRFCHHFQRKRTIAMVTVILVKTLNKVSNLPFHIMFIANEVFFSFPVSIWKPPIPLIGNTGKKRFFQ